MHPDHVGGARDVARLTGRPVLQGREDFAQCVSAWGPGPRCGAVCQPLARQRGAGRRPRATWSVRPRRSPRAVHYAPAPELLDAGDDVDGWGVEVLRGHADGHIVLIRDGVLIAGDTILDADLAGRRRLSELAPRSARRLPGDARRGSRQLAPRVAYAGHGPSIDDPAARANELREHHRERIDFTEAALAHRPGERVAGLVRAVSRQPRRRPAALRRGGDARAPRAPRLRGTRGARGRRRIHARSAEAARDSASIPWVHAAASDRRSRRAGQLSRARADAAPARRRGDRGAQGGPARRARRARDPGRRVDDVHPADAPLRARRCGQGLRRGRSSARVPG